MFEIQASDSKERREMEARINFRLDVVTKTLLNISSRITGNHLMANQTVRLELSSSIKSFKFSSIFAGTCDVTVFH